MNLALNDILPPLDDLKKRLEGVDITRVNGRVEQVVGLVIESTGPIGIGWRGLLDNFFGWSRTAGFG